MIRTPQPFARLVGSAEALYAAWTGHSKGSSVVRERIARLDLRTGDVIKSERFGHAARYTSPGDIAVTGGAIWATVPRQGGSTRVYRFDPRTLASRGSTKLPLPPSTLVPSLAGLWVGATRHLYLLDPVTGHVRRTVNIAGRAGEMAVDPSGRILYVSTHPPGYADGKAFQERDARTGELLVSRLDPGGFGASKLSPTKDGVWLSGPTGNFGAVVFFRARGLHEEPKHLIEAMQDVRAIVASGRLWITVDAPGDREVKCADARTGRILGSVPIPGQLSDGYGFNDIAAARSHIYLATGRGVIRFSPRLCR